MADEVTDKHANQEILSLCIRFVDFSQVQPHINEIFLDFLHLDRATGENIGAGIIGLLNKHGIEVNDMRGQSYDGASAMSGKRSGTQAFIKKKNALGTLTVTHTF